MPDFDYNSGYLTDTTTSKRGGSRPNSGRKKRYGNTPTVRYIRVVPVEWVEDVDEFIAKLRLTNCDKA